MRKKQVLLSGLLMLMGVSMANAPKAYTYVQQNDVKIDELGTAAFDLSSSPTVEFVDGKAVMTIGDNTVAKLPMSDKGQLAVGVFNNTGGVSPQQGDVGLHHTFCHPLLPVPAHSAVRRCRGICPNLRCNEA